MPEGHTLHRLAHRHNSLFEGNTVEVSSPQGRFADGAAMVTGCEFEHAEAWGKHLFHHYTGDRIVHIHLGLYGAFSEFDGDLEVTGQVRMRIIRPELVSGVDLRGPTACDVVTPAEMSSIIGRLGVDPLRRRPDRNAVWQKVSRSRAPVATLLMDQRVIAGVGNVYRAEVLFRQHINPYRAGKDLSYEEFNTLWDDVVALMKIGVRTGRIHVIRSEDDHGAPSYRAGRPRTYVYRRAGEPCRLCGTAIRLDEHLARKLYWCPSCQR